MSDRELRVAIAKIAEYTNLSEMENDPTLRPAYTRVRAYLAEPERAEGQCVMCEDEVVGRMNGAAVCRLHYAKPVYEGLGPEPLPELTEADARELLEAHGHVVRKRERWGWTVDDLGVFGRLVAAAATVGIYDIPTRVRKTAKG